MQWTDNYNEGPLLVPLTCWIPPPKIKEVIFSIVINLKIVFFVRCYHLIFPIGNHQKQ